MCLRGFAQQRIRKGLSTGRNGMYPDIEEEKHPRVAVGECSKLWGC